MSTPEELVKLLSQHDVAFVDCRFTDTLGREHHLTVPAHSFDEERIEAGIAFDGSSLPGWKGWKRQTCCYYLTQQLLAWIRFAKNLH